MILDISRVDSLFTKFYWLSRLCEANKISKLVISKDQANKIFCAGLDRWTDYRGIKLEIKDEK